MEYVIDLHGHILKKRSKYKLKFNYPRFKGSNSAYTRDRITKESFILIKRKKHWYYLTYIAHLRMYFIQTLDYIRYEKKLDIRFEYQYHKDIQQFEQKLKKDPKAYWSYCTSDRQ